MARSSGSVLKQVGGLYAVAKQSPLTALQKMYVDAFFECGGVIKCIGEKISRSRAQVYIMGKSNSVKLAIAMRSNEVAQHVIADPDFMVSKSDRIELLWNMAKKGSELIYDKEGNEVMANPAVSVSSIRTINEMVAGSLAPKEVTITHKDDTRTEAEIRANIATLMNQFNDLVSIEGETVTEDEVQEVTKLPDLSMYDDTQTLAEQCAISKRLRAESEANRVDGAKRESLRAKRNEMNIEA